MSSARALACPASLKGVLSASEAATALAEGLGTWAEPDELPVADGGEGTLEALGGRLTGVSRHLAIDAFGRPREARVGELGETRVVVAAEVLPLDPARLDPLGASSRGLGELLSRIDGSDIYVGLGGTANMDGGAGLLEVLHELPARMTVLCDVETRLYDAPRVYGPQKGATAEGVELLEARLRAREDLAPFAELPGSGAAGGLGAALASLGAELVPGAARVLELIGFDPSGYDLVVTGEGTVDATTTRGKAPGEVARRCREAGIRCVVFGGRVVEPVPGVETVALSGDPARAREDLVTLGSGLG